MEGRTHAQGLAGMNRVVGGVVVAVVLVLGTAGAASADTGGESIESYRIDYEIKADGVVHVKEDFRYNFSGSDHHGPERLISTREPAGDDRDRIYTISNATASSDTSAPDDVDVSDLGDDTRIRIGDPEITVSGQQQYTLEYDIEGGLNSVGGRGELYWDAAGPEWDVPIDDLTVTVRAPGAGISKQRCLFGTPGSDDPCDNSALSAGEATFEQARVEPGEVLTVVAAFSLDDVTVPAPVLAERPSPLDQFVPTPLSGGIAAALLAFGMVPFAFTLRGRRDLRYAGVTPGQLPPSGVAAATERAPAQGADEVAVQFVPPAGITAGEAGALLRRKLSTVDTTATLIDLAVRGYLHIDGSGGSWTLTARRPPDNTLRPHELALLSGLFRNSPTISLGRSSRTLVSVVKQVNHALARSAVERGWFRKLSATTGFPVGAVIGLVFGGWMLFVFALPAMGILQALGLKFQFGLVGISLVVMIGLLIATFVLRRRRGRLPAGYAAHYQVLGFKRYLETAEAEQLRFEEGENIFSRYLPWAIVFGLTHRWAQICERLAQQGRIPPDVDWYHGSQAWSYAGFTSSYAAFSSAVTTSSTPVSSSSAGGGSGFSSSSSSGGGGGGGGGGSW